MGDYDKLSIDPELIHSIPVVDDMTTRNSIFKQ